MLKTPSYDYEYWDLQFYYKIHIARQKAQWEIPLKYDQFIKRLKTMNLHDAIYTPRSKEVKPRKSKTPIQDHQRRMAKLKDENVPIVTFEEMEKVEKKHHRPKKKKPRYNMKPNRIKNMRFRFISFFKG